jgi:hypothetical protein
VEDRGDARWERVCDEVETLYALAIRYNWFPICHCPTSGLYCKLFPHIDGSPKSDCPTAAAAARVDAAIVMLATVPA